MKATFIDSATIDNAGGVGLYVAVVQGASDGSVKLPTGANAAGFQGITLSAQVVQNAPVSIGKAGTIRVTAGGNITRGDRLAINSAAGDVKSVEAQITAAPGAPAVVNVIGQAQASAVAGDVFDMWISPFVVSIATS